jgi:hypothetical protein
MGSPAGSVGQARSGLGVASSSCFQRGSKAWARLDLNLRLFT